MSIAELLNEPVPSHAVSTREGPGGRPLSYVKEAYVEQRLNEIFGPLGWSATTEEMIEAVKPHKKETSKGPRWVVAFRARTRIVAHEGDVGAVRDGWGYGEGIDKEPGQAVESAIKEAESDSLKRAAKRLGKALGLSLYLDEPSAPKASPRQDTPRSNSNGRSTDVFRFGKTKEGESMKGWALDDERVRMRDLQWYAQAIARSIDDPEKARFRDDNIATHRAVLAEIARREQGMQQDIARSVPEPAEEYFDSPEGDDWHGQYDDSDIPFG